MPLEWSNEAMKDGKNKLSSESQELYNGISWENPRGHSDREWTFCYKCGAKMIPVRLKRKYFRKGHPVYKMVMACPDSTWWNFHSVCKFNSEWGYWRLDPSEFGD